MCETLAGERASPSALLRGDLRDVVYPVSGATIRYTHDALGQIESLTELGQGLIASYDYRGLGQIVRRTRRYYVEYEIPGSNRGPAHLERILANDPHGVVELIEQP